ncbi:MAG: hypothetical protein ACOC5E_02900, partial [Acidobacteriota bacterium]
MSRTPIAADPFVPASVVTHDTRSPNGGRPLRRSSRVFLAPAVLIGLALALPTAGPGARAEEEGWTRFRGPNGSGVSSATGLPERFGP